MIRSSRYLPDHLRTIVDKVISNKAHFAHPEAVLLAMLNDERREVRIDGYSKLLRAKRQEALAAGRDVPRPWVMPKVRFEASDYTRLIQWTNADLTVPPTLSYMTVADIDAALRDLPGPLRSPLPSHTQSVERTIKLVTEASEAVCGYERRHGFIKTTIVQRQVKAERLAVT
jgi:hypothetical protein